MTLVRFPYWKTFLVELFVFQFLCFDYNVLIPGVGFPYWKQFLVELFVFQFLCFDYNVLILGVTFPYWKQFLVELFVFQFLCFDYNVLTPGVRFPYWKQFLVELFVFQFLCFDVKLILWQKKKKKKMGLTYTNSIVNWILIENIFKIKRKHFCFLFTDLKLLMFPYNIVKWSEILNLLKTFLKV